MARMHREVCWVSVQKMFYFNNLHQKMSLGEA
jgi:hypothetical protein